MRGDDRATNAARARTIAHMRKMLATAAALAAAGCAREATPSSTVTLPPAPSSTASHAPPPRSTASAASSARRVESDDDVLETRHPHMGYDPVPPPSYCPSVGASTTAHATIKHDAAGVVIELTVSLPAKGAGVTTFAPTPPSQATPQPMVWGGTLVSAHVTKTTAVVRIRPDGSLQGAVQTSLPLLCNSGPGYVQVRATFKYPPRAGGKATITYVQSR